MKKLLIADDNKQITSILEGYAKKEGFDTTLANDGELALSLFFQYSFDLILLDVMMPKLDGFEVCREIRKHSNVPIIMVTARGEDFDRIMGLDIGADDYIVKPFSPAEVMARIRAILRRFAHQEKHRLHHDNLEICLDQYTVKINGNLISLTKKELELLWILASSKDRLFTREHLLDLIWGLDYYGDSRTVDSHIKRLRAKLDKETHPTWMIATVWGMGYKFTGEKTDEV